MKALHLKLLKYLPLLSVLGFLGFIKTVDNHFNYSYFGFFVFLFAYWEYKFLLSEPQEEILDECYRWTKKYIIYPVAAILCLVFILMFYFKWIGYDTLIDLAVLSICLLAVSGMFIVQKRYYKLKKTSFIEN